MKKYFKIPALILIFSFIFLSGCEITFIKDNNFYPDIETHYSDTPLQNYEYPLKNEDYSFGDVNVMGEKPSLPDMLEKTRPSVVEIYTYLNETDTEEYGAGSGVFIAKSKLIEGVYYVLTCYHVIETENYYKVKDVYGNEFTATYVGGDKVSDIAVLKVTPLDDGYNLNDKDHPNYVQISISSIRLNEGGNAVLRVGDSVYAIGNPLGTLGGTVTQGIISSTDREVLVEGKKMTLIQTDCAINPGNSGGGLFDEFGNLIGIVNAGFMGEIEGLNFAISTDTIYEKVASIIKNGYIEGKGNINFAHADEILGYQDISVVEYTVYSKNYVVISSLTEFYYNLGLRVNDIIVSVSRNGEEYALPTTDVQDEHYETVYLVDHFVDYMSYLDLKVGEEITLKVVHNGERVTTDINITLKQFII